MTCSGSARSARGRRNPRSICTSPHRLQRRSGASAALLLCASHLQRGSSFRACGSAPRRRSRGRTGSRRSYAEDVRVARNSNAQSADLTGLERDLRTHELVMLGAPSIVPTSVLSPSLRAVRRPQGATSPGGFHHSLMHAVAPSRLVQGWPSVDRSGPCRTVLRSSVLQRQTQRLYSTTRPVGRVARRPRSSRSQLLRMPDCDGRDDRLTGSTPEDQDIDVVETRVRLEVRQRSKRCSSS